MYAVLVRLVPIGREPARYPPRELRALLMECAVHDDGLEHVHVREDGVGSTVDVTLFIRAPERGAATRTAHLVCMRFCSLVGGWTIWHI